ncbi:unnamed protein product [Urochloa humidicola]
MEKNGEAWEWKGEEAGARLRGNGREKKQRLWSLICTFRLLLLRREWIIPRTELDTIKGSFLNWHVSEEA